LFGRFILFIIVAVALAGCASSPDVYHGSASALYNKGVGLVNKGRYSQARDVFHEYIASYEETHLYPVSLYYLGYCYQKLDDPQQAVSIYHKVIDISNDEFWTQMAKKRIQEIQGEKP